MPSFGEAVDLTVYRCLQEGVTNSIRHGKAGAIDVELVEKRPRAHAGNGANGAANGKANGAANGVAAVPELHLRIQDDGRGIAPDTPLGFGLTVMRERVTALGGTCTIKSTPALADVRLLTVTLDPEFDRPAILKAYARRREADPAVWTFLTGEPMEVNRFATQFGLYVEHNPQDAINITHNLRTAVIDPEGRLVSVHSGNSWTPAELVADLTAAPAPTH